MSLRRFGLATLALVACGGPPRTVTPTPVPANVPGPGGPEAAIAKAEKCVEPRLAPAADRDRGLEALVADRPFEAVEHFEAALKADPRDRIASAFRSVSRAKLAEKRLHATDAAASVRRVSLEPIPFAATQKRAVASPAAKVKLEKVSETKNLITDDRDWETKNQVRLRAEVTV